MEFQEYTGYNIDKRIMKERNLEIQNIEKDLLDLSEIMADLSVLISEQGEELDISEIHINEAENSTKEAIQSLSNAEIYVNKSRKILRNLGIILGGAGLGSIGFLAGPFVGAVTLVSGGVLGSGIAFVTNKIF